MSEHSESTSDTNVASSTKELTEEGAKVVTVAEGTNATAAAPAEPAPEFELTYYPGRGAAEVARQVRAGIAECESGD